MVIVDVAGVEPAYSPLAGLPYTPVCLVAAHQTWCMLADDGTT